jgi:hypothetical protein
MGFRDFGLLIYAEPHHFLDPSQPPPHFAYSELVEDIGYRDEAELSDRYVAALEADAKLIDPSKPRLYWTDSKSDLANLGTALRADFRKVERSQPEYQQIITGVGRYVAISVVALSVPALPPNPGRSRRYAPSTANEPKAADRPGASRVLVPAATPCCHRSWSPCGPSSPGLLAIHVHGPGGHRGGGATSGRCGHPARSRAGRVRRAGSTSSTVRPRTSADRADAL